MERKVDDKMKISAPIQFRAAEIGAIDGEKRTIELSFSSEQPVDRFFGIEILDHGKGSVVTDWLNSGRAPLLADHDPSIQIGVVESSEIGKDRVGRAVVRFGKGTQADAYFQDVQDGIRTNISVGYRIHQMILEEENDSGAIYRATKWEPLEISLVSIPADQSVGIGRAAGEEKEIQILNQKTNMEKRTMDKIEPGAANAPANAATVDENQIRANLNAENAKRTNEIMALAKRHNMVEKGVEFVGNGKSVEDFRSFVLENIGAAKPVDNATRDNGMIGLSDKEAQNFSMVRAINAVVSGNWRNAEFEREVVDATAKKFSGRDFKGNIQIPTDVLFAGRKAAAEGRRDLNVSNDTQGGYLKATKMGSFIEILENRLLVKQLGATIISGLDGDVTFPRETSIPSYYFVSEGEDVTESTPGLGQLKLTPKTVGAVTEVTRRMLLQSSLDVESWLRNRLARSLAKGVDYAALKGTGADGEPLGILNTTGIGSVTITTGTYTHAKLVDLETEVALDNADLGKLAYLTSATDRGIMKKTEKASNTGKYLWESVAGQPGVGEVNGYLGYATNQLSADQTIFGNWEDLMIGEWGLLDLLVNPYANDKNGGVRVRALQDVDVGLAHVGSFAKTTT